MKYLILATILFYQVTRSDSLTKVDFLHVEKRPFELVKKNLGKKIIIYGVIRNIQVDKSFEIINVGNYGELLNKPDYPTEISVLLPQKFKDDVKMGLSTARINEFGVFIGTVVVYKHNISLLVNDLTNVRISVFESKAPSVR